MQRLNAVITGVGGFVPDYVLSNEELLAETGLLPPEPVRVYLDLKKQGIYLPDCPLTEEELARMLCQLKQEI